MSATVVSLRPGRSYAIFLLALAGVFCATHVPFLNRTPGTVDAVNLVLGVDEFDLADHRPHPPGYPIIIALGKLSRMVLERSGPAAAAGTVQALAFWSAVFGTIAPVVLFYFFRSFDADARRATAATVLTVTCPLFWFNAARPMSDIPGLVTSVMAQALLLTGWRRQQTWVTVAAALVSGIAIGFRIQNALLTVPLLLWVVLQRRSIRDAAAHAAAWLVGVLMWAVPMIVAVGGPAGYLVALTAQGGEDFAGADILATNATPERLITGLIHTFAYPWGNAGIAAVMLVLSLIGTIARRTGTRSDLVVLAICTIPYAVFHLLFQESVHVRYALPLLPATAYLTARGLYTLSPRAMPALVAALAITGVVIGFPPVAAFARTASPSFQALDDIRQRTAAEKTNHVLVTHHAVSRLLRGAETPIRVLPVSPKHEWLAMVKHWQEQPDVPVWFLAESGRRDLALVDPHSRKLVRSYSWPFQRKFLMSRTPADGLDWYELSAPGWIAGEGWSLTPESAGVALHDGRGPHNGGIVALARRRHEAAILMVGGRNTSGPSGPTASFELSVAGRRVDTWTVKADAPFFLRTIRLAAGALAGPVPYLPVTIRAHAAAGDPRTFAVAIEQFDLQPATTPVYGFDTGWYELEFDGGARGPWRWTAPVAVARVHHGGRDLVLRIAGDVPLDQLARAPVISVRAGEHRLAHVTARDNTFDLEVTIPAAMLDRAGGLLTIETDQSFVPHDVFRNGDRRRVGLRVYDFDLSAPVEERGLAGHDRHLVF